ncbi:hypothetical protein [Nocardia niigatensis]
MTGFHTPGLNPPPHIARPSGGLVGPLVWFRNQPIAVTSSPPRDTTDPRYGACTDHRLACDCREAELAERLTDQLAEVREMRNALMAACTGHPTKVYVDNRPRVDLECRCLPCAALRHSNYVPSSNTRYLTTWGNP